MYIQPYPFHCIIVYDDCEDETVLRNFDQFQKLYRLNIGTERIQKKREVRQKIRCLGRWGGLIHKPFVREESESVPDGTESYTETDSQGRTHRKTRTVYSRVYFDCHYTQGQILVSGQTDKVMSAGFDVTMNYRDGAGSAVTPRTHRHVDFHDRVAVMPQEHIGLENSMDESPSLAQLFHQLAPILQVEMPKLVAEHMSYRENLMKKFREANIVLGAGFWFYVYNHHHLTESGLRHYLDTSETNPILRALPTTHPAALKFIFKRMAVVSIHPALRLWYVFWDDFYYNNRDMAVLQQLETLDVDFNPLQASSIGYHVKKREDLEVWLDARGLMGSDPSWQSTCVCAKRLFNARNLTALYRRMHELEHPTMIQVKVSSMASGV